MLIFYIIQNAQTENRNSSLDFQNMAEVSLVPLKMIDAKANTTAVETNGGYDSEELDMATSLAWTKDNDDASTPLIRTSTTYTNSEEDNGKCTVKVVTKYMCRFCAQQFESQQEMQTHIELHANKKTSVHSCFVCGKTYTTPSKLQRHVRVHSGERPYACNICGRRFTRSDHVKQHLKVHLPQKQRNSCRLCGTKFLRRQTLQSHLQQNHGIMQVINPFNTE